MVLSDWIAIAALLSAFGVGAWQVLSLHNDSKDARDQARKDLEQDKWKNDMETRMSNTEKANQIQDLAMKDLISRNELSAITKEIFDEMKGMRSEMSTSLTNLQNSILSAISHRGSSGQGQ